MRRAFTLQLVEASTHAHRCYGCAKWIRCANPRCSLTRSGTNCGARWKDCRYHTPTATVICDAPGDFSLPPTGTAD